MILYNPTDHRSDNNTYIVQGFGIKNTSPSLLKDYQSICIWRNGEKYCLKGHNGVDLYCKRGELIYYNSPNVGRVYKVNNEDNNSAGCGIEIISKEDGQYYKHTYWHFIAGSIKHKVGDIVFCGQQIGLGDSTGWSTGDHLHYMVKPCDKDGNIDFWDNGYFGAIDPTPYMVLNTFAKDRLKITIKGLILQLLIRLIKIKYV